MASDPVTGFGERITTRARLPCTTVVAIPFMILIVGSFFALLERGSAPLDALKEVHEATSLLLAPAAVVPVVIFSILRELYLHELLAKFEGSKSKVAAKISSLMAELAKECGYAHPNRIADRQSDAMNWFYFHINRAEVTRERAFEIWEGLYVNLYISLACLVSAALCLYLAIVSGLNWIWWSTSAPAILLLLFYAVRRFLIVPKIISTPVQQVRDILRDADILIQARSRFGE